MTPFSFFFKQHHFSFLQTLNTTSELDRREKAKNINLIKDPPARMKKLNGLENALKDKEIKICGWETELVHLAKTQPQNTTLSQIHLKIISQVL